MWYIRFYLGKWIFYLGYRVMPANVRKRISQMCAIGVAWAEKDCPDRFEITMKN